MYKFEPLQNVNVCITCCLHLIQTLYKLFLSMIYLLFCCSFSYHSALVNQFSAVVKLGLLYLGDFRIMRKDTIDVVLFSVIYILCIFRIMESALFPFSQS